jgi:hypothetical protein
LRPCECRDSGRPSSAVEYGQDDGLLYTWGKDEGEAASSSVLYDDLSNVFDI